MKSLLAVLALVMLSLNAKSDEINDIVKQSIAQTAPENTKPLPKIGVEEYSEKVKSGDKKCDNPGCSCKDCNCIGCKCKPGYKCDCNGCKKLGSEPLVDKCFVIIDDVKIFTIEGVTPSQAMASIKEQGSRVVFIDAHNTVIDPPAWYTGKVAMSGSSVKATPVYQTPVYQTPVYRGVSAGFNFNGPFGGGFSAGACVGGT